MEHGQRVISRALRLMAAGKARSWSHALALAAESAAEQAAAKKETR